MAVVEPKPAPRLKPNPPVDSEDMYQNVNVPGPVKVENLEDYINSKSGDKMNKLSHEFDVSWVPTFWLSCMMNILHSFLVVYVLKYPKY